MARILITIGKLDIGGTELYLLRYLPKINKETHQIEICTFSEPGVLAPQFIDSGIPVHCIKLEKEFFHDGLKLKNDDKESHAVHSEQKLHQLYSIGENKNQFELNEKLSNLPSHQTLASQERLENLITKTIKKAIVLFFHPFWIICALIKWNTISAIRFLYHAMCSILNSFLFRFIQFNSFFKSEYISRKIVHYYLSHSEKAFPNTQLINKLSGFITTNKFEIVHCFLPDAYYLGALAAVKANCRNIVMSRLSLNLYQDSDSFYYFWERKLLHRLVSIGIGNCEAVCRDLHNEGMEPNKIRLVYNGIEYENFARDNQKRSENRIELGIPERTFVMTAVGNLHPYKGHADLIEALRRQQTVLGDEWVLLIIGHDVNGHQGVLEEMILNYRLADHIRLLGSRNDVASLLSTSDLHVMPSHQEGFPNSVLEAMSASLPVVATTAGGIPELITDGFNGRLVPPSDPDALGRAIADLFNDPVLRIEMGQQSMNIIETKFGLQRSINDHNGIYSDLLNSM